MFTEPLIFFLADSAISKMTVTLPSGKQLLFDKGENRMYKTDDPEEIKFLTTSVKRLGARKLSDKEYRLHTARLFDNLPLVTKDIKTIEQVEKYLWNTEFERLVISILRQKGYTVASQTEKVLDKKTGQDSINLDGEDDGKEVQAKAKEKVKTKPVPDGPSDKLKPKVTHKASTHKGRGKGKK